jgi:hypothetical protein
MLGTHEIGSAAIVAGCSEDADPVDYGLGQDRRTVKW